MAGPGAARPARAPALAASPDARRGACRIGQDHPPRRLGGPQSDAPVAWYRAESVDGSDAALAAHLAAAFGAAAPGPGWRLAHGRTGGRGAGHPAGAAPPARDRRPPRADRDPGRGGPGALPRIRAAVAGGRRRDAGAAGVQPVPASRLRGAPGADRRRPPLPIVGGGASLPRLLRRGATPRRAGAPRPAHRGLGRRPAALPPRDPGQADRRAPAAPRRARPELAAHARVPHPQRRRRAARRAPRVPRRDVRPAAPDGLALRSPARPAGQPGAPRGAGAAQRLHGGRRRRGHVPLPRGPAEPPRGDARRDRRRGGRAGAGTPGRGAPRGRRRDRGGRRRLQSRRGVGAPSTGSSTATASAWPPARAPGWTPCRRPCWSRTPG